MRIAIQWDRTLRVSAELAELSGTMRRLEGHIADTRRELRGLSGLEQCLKELSQQEEAVFFLASRLSALSSALRDISELYGSTEAKNGNMLQP